MIDWQLLQIELESMTLSFERDFYQAYDELVAVAPRLRRLLARNPSPFTFKGTGVLVVGDRNVAVIDPGPDDPHHLETLKCALRNETVTHILVTHTHRDHSPASRALKQWTGAPIYGFAPHVSATAAEEFVVEEGSDTGFRPDIEIGDGDVIDGRDFQIECIHTPGHTSNHVCYALKGDRALFCGDHVMAWSTTVVAPPDGDMADYLDSLRKLLVRDDAIYWPTHGGPIRDPKPLVQAYLEHRYDREAEILGCLRDGVQSIPEMVGRIYVGLDPRLRGAAGLSVLAHILKLHNEGRVIARGAPALAARFELS
jgi:glyoxylase-like metal-dependent hydrolase (beta-lactamase superfamily II)